MRLFYRTIFSENVKFILTNKRENISEIMKM